MAKNYWYNKNKGVTKGNKEEANLAHQDSDDFEDMVVRGAIADDHVKTKIRFLDSGCSNHMTGRSAWLVDFGSSKKTKVKLADNSSLQVKGTGDIVIPKSNGGKTMISGVLYVP